MKVFASIGFTLAAAAAFAQTGGKDVSFSGRVTGRIVGSEGDMMLTVKAKNGGTAQVSVAPEAYLARLEAPVRTGDRVRIAGIKVRRGDSYMVFAQQITAANGRTVGLRGPDGRPLWRASDRLIARNTENDPTSSPVEDGDFVADPPTPVAGVIGRPDGPRVAIVGAPRADIAPSNLMNFGNGYVNFTGMAMPLPIGPFAMFADAYYGPNSAITIGPRGFPVNGFRR